MTQADVIAANLSAVRDGIAEAALRAGRSPDEVHLVAVTKTHPPEMVVVAWEAGQRYFGENRPEEGEAKIPRVRELLSGAPADAQPVWHMIGHIQSRKARLVAAFFDVVHSLDRLKVARRLSVCAVEAGRGIPVLLECNVSGEASKSGYAAAGWESDAEVRSRLLDEVRSVVELPGLRVDGLMTMAPIVDDAEDVRPIFASLRALRDWLGESFPQLDLLHLSMGMTSDYQVAVEEGATLVRVGRAIFGARGT